MTRAIVSLAWAAAFIGLAAWGAAVAGLEVALPSVRAHLPPIPRPSMPMMAGGPRDQYTYVWAAGALESTSMYAPEALVLRVVRRVPDKQAVLELAERLGIRVTPEDRKRLPDKQEGELSPLGVYMCSLEEKNVDDQRLFDCKDVELWDSGCFSYLHRGGTPEPGSRNGPAPPDAPSPERAREIADRFIADSGLLPEGCEFERVRAAVTQNAEGLEIHYANGARPRVLSRQVVYTRQVDRIPLGDFSVEVNGNGEVYRVSRQIPNFAPLARYPILSPDEARRMIPRGLLASHIWGPARAVIGRVSLSYSPAWSFSGVIQPAYTFSGTAHGRNGQTDSFSVMWPAVRPEHFEADRPRP